MYSLTKYLYVCQLHINYYALTIPLYTYVLVYMYILKMKTVIAETQVYTRLEICFFHCKFLHDECTYIVMQNFHVHYTKYLCLQVSQAPHEEYRNGSAKLHYKRCMVGLRMVLLLYAIIPCLDAYIQLLFL